MLIIGGRGRFSMWYVIMTRIDDDGDGNDGGDGDCDGDGGGDDDDDVADAEDGMRAGAVTVIHDHYQPASPTNITGLAL